MDELKSSRQSCPLSDRISLSIQDAAELLGVSDRLVYDWLKKYPDFPAVKIGGRKLISRPLLQAWFEKHVEQGVL